MEFLDIDIILIFSGQIWVKIVHIGMRMSYFHVQRMIFAHCFADESNYQGNFFTGAILLFFTYVIHPKYVQILVEHIQNLKLSYFWRCRKHIKYQTATFLCTKSNGNT